MMMDRFMRWSEVVQDIFAGMVAETRINTWIVRFGVPKTIITD